MSEPDKIQRYMNAEGTFRMLAARGTRAVGKGVAFCQTSPEVTAPFGELLIGSALLQHAQGPGEWYQLQLEHSGSAGVMVAEVRPGPVIRGRVQFPKGGALLPTSVPFKEPATIHVTRQPDPAFMRNGQRYQSSAPVHGGRVDSALQQFVLESEQVLSFFSLVCVPGAEGEVKVAGGLVVQALPGWEREHLAAITLSLEANDFAELVRGGVDPLDAADRILAPVGSKLIGSDSLQYRCRCSKETAARVVGMLERDELRHLEQGGMEIVVCEFCGTAYEVRQSDLTASSSDHSEGAAPNTDDSTPKV